MLGEQKDGQAPFSSILNLNLLKGQSCAASWRLASTSWGWEALLLLQLPSLRGEAPTKGLTA